MITIPIIAGKVAQMSILEIVLYCGFGALALIMMINTILKIVKIRKMRKKGLSKQQIEEKDEEE